jgi:hypothetical protein
MPQMIIANRLIDGVVVFMAPGGGWDTAIAAGAVIDDGAEAERLLAAAKQDEAHCVIIDPNLIEVAVEDGGPRPTAIREAIRAFGPTVRTDVIEV